MNYDIENSKIIMNRGVLREGLTDQRRLVMQVNITLTLIFEA